MKVENVILIISIIVMLIGIWAVYYSLKLWNPNYRPRKLIAKLIRQSLGSKGTQIFTIIFGTVLILFGSGMTYMTLTKGKLNPYSSYNKSEWITISVFNAQMGAILRSKVSLEKQKISRSGKDHLKNYQTVSFKNNGIKEIPNFVWDMSNLEKLDMTNNELKKIPENKLESLTNLKFLILNGNPIDTLYVKSLKSKTKAEIEFNIPEKTKEK